MKKVGNFEILHAMAERELDIRLAPLSNIIRLRRTKAGTQITIGVPGDVVSSIYLGRFVGGLILAEKGAFERTRVELESSTVDEESQS